MTEEKQDLRKNILILAAVVAAAVLWWGTFKVWVMFFVTLGLLVAIHEWGHFIAAKSVGVRVYEFAFGFGPKVVTYMRRGGTDYTIRLFPLGGFVNPKGMQPDDPITPDGINGRRPAERALVYLAGPLMNIILAVFVFALSGFLFGTSDESKVLVGPVTRKSEAQRMGLRVGDQILQINGKTVTGQDMVVDEINPNIGKQVVLEVLRGGKTQTLTGTVQPLTQKTEFLTVTQVPEGTQLDVRPNDLLIKIDGEYPGSASETPEQAAARVLREKEGRIVTLTLWRGSQRVVTEGPAVPLNVEVREGERTLGILGFQPIGGQGPRLSFAESVQTGLARLVGVFQVLAAMFARPKVLGESVGGPVAIWSILGDAMHLPAFYYVLLLGNLSLSLAVFNLLPIPVLDGGHMLLLTWEVLRRRRLDPEAHKMAMAVGVAIIGVIFILIMGKDILKHFL